MRAERRTSPSPRRAFSRTYEEQLQNGGKMITRLTQNGVFYSVINQAGVEVWSDSAQWKYSHTAIAQRWKAKTHYLATEQQRIANNL